MKENNNWGVWNNAGEARKNSKNQQMGSPFYSRLKSKPHLD